MPKQKHNNIGMATVIDKEETGRENLSWIEHNRQTTTTKGVGNKQQGLEKQARFSLQTWTKDDYWVYKHK